MTTHSFSHHSDLDSLVAAARAEFCRVVEAKQAGGGDAYVVLTGGGAGIGLLRALRADSGAIDWQRVHVFFGDERFVPAADGDRNALQAREALLNHVDIPAAQIHEIAASDGEFGDDPDAAAAAYAAVIADQAPEGYDIHLLGMGGEGHINSIFPHTAEVAEGAPPVMAVRNCPKPPPTRVTLTLPEIHRAQHVWLLVAGQEKAQAVRGIAGGLPARDLPAAGVQGQQSTIVFVDAAAASELN
ncbi:6-phosphogluconolactonase [Corynebacterium ulceribovis]|uniref:6-phosphogluconolactonase n=1 Tax=Corynebacterium ulceribovis TaxID=487732 RepID=UPI000369935A|nr:6-phosphogluconolactonase [Corynebacterium ulceribovis]